MILLACQAKSGIKLIHIFYAETLGEGEGHGYLFRSSVHCIDIGEVYDSRFVSEMFERYVGKVKMYAFHKQIGGDQYLLI